jgi:hypothetical protein
VKWEAMMEKRKKFFGVFLALFAVAGLGTWAWKTFNPGVSTGGQMESSAKVVVYYLHTSYRCVTCRKFETYTQAELAANFSKQMKDGTLVYKIVNVEEAGNEHFVQDYDLKSKSIVLVAPGAKSRWKNLDKIWDEVASEVGFKRYIQTEIEAFLAGAS